MFTPAKLATLCLLIGALIICQRDASGLLAPASPSTRTGARMCRYEKETIRSTDRVENSEGQDRGFNFDIPVGITSKPSLSPGRYIDDDHHQESRRMFLGTVAATTAGLVLSTTTTTESKANAATLGADMASSTPSPAIIDWKGTFQKASKRALGGGKAGASAAVVQVVSLMWLRTSMNYQYRYGGNLQTSLQTLWDEGGIPRLYQGLPFALVQGPLTRFGDTAANIGILALLETLPLTQDLPLPLKTACGSIAAGAWRIILMPIDASKTSMQVEGASGLSSLWGSVREKGPGPLYRGALAQAAATAVGHFPWFLTYNFLNEQLPVVNASDDLLLSVVRSAVLGVCSSCVSDCASNSLRVIKTTKQTAQLGLTAEEALATKELGYGEVVAMILEKDGVAGLFGRGLQTRLLTNAVQGAVFSVLWKYFQQQNGV